MFLKNKNIISKIRRSKVTDYAALNEYIHSFPVGLNDGLGLNLHPNFVYMSSKSSDEAAHIDLLFAYAKCEATCTCIVLKCRITIDYTVLHSDCMYYFCYADISVKNIRHTTLFMSV